MLIRLLTQMLQNRSDRMKREREELRATLSKFMGPNENEYGVVYIINVDEHIMIFYYYYYFLSLFRLE